MRAMVVEMQVCLSWEWPGVGAHLAHKDETFFFASSRCLSRYRATANCFATARWKSRQLLLDFQTARAFSMLAFLALFLLSLSSIWRAACRASTSMANWALALAASSGVILLYSARRCFERAFFSLIEPFPKGSEE